MKTVYKDLILPKLNVMHDQSAENPYPKLFWSKKFAMVDSWLHLGRQHCVISVRCAWPVTRFCLVSRQATDKYYSYIE